MKPSDLIVIGGVIAFAINGASKDWFQFGVPSAYLLVFIPAWWMARWFDERWTALVWRPDTPWPRPGEMTLDFEYVPPRAFEIFRWIVKPLWRMDPVWGQIATLTVARLLDRLDSDHRYWRIVPS